MNKPKDNQEIDMVEKAKEIGARIKNLRKEKGESQANLGEALTLKQNQISKIEMGAANLTLYNLLALSSHFNVSVEYLCHGYNRDSALDLLTQYIEIKYANLSYGEDETYYYPVMHINKALYSYLIHIAEAKNKYRYMPEKIREEWENLEKSAFHQNASSDKESFVPYPLDLVSPDSRKSEWTQKDLLREFVNYLMNF